MDPLAINDDDHCYYNGPTPTTNLKIKKISNNLSDLTPINNTPNVLKRQSQNTDQELNKKSNTKIRFRMKPTPSLIFKNGNNELSKAFSKSLASVNLDKIKNSINKNFILKSKIKYIGTFNTTNIDKESAVNDPIETITFGPKSVLINKRKIPISPPPNNGSESTNKPPEQNPSSPIRCKSSADLKTSTNLPIISSILLSNYKVICYKCCSVIPELEYTEVDLIQKMLLHFICVQCRFITGSPSKTYLDDNFDRANEVTETSDPLEFQEQLGPKKNQIKEKNGEDEKRNCASFINMEASPDEDVDNDEVLHDDNGDKVKRDNEILENNCGAEFLTRNEFLMHEKGHCTQKTKAIPSTTKQQQLHRENLDIQYNCRVCKATFRNFKARTDHELKFHRNIESKMYECMLCDERFQFVYLLEDHIESHENDLEYKCNKCEENFANYSALMTHYNTHVAQAFSEPGRHVIFKGRRTEHYCVLCDKSYQTRHLLSNHKYRAHGKIKHEYDCRICMKKFSRRSLRRQHEIDKHCNSETNLYHSEFCSKKFKTIFELKDHIVYHNDNNNKNIKLCMIDLKDRAYSHIVRTSEGTVRGQVTEYYCQICDISYAKRRSFILHKSHVHRTSQKPSEYKCRICEKSFSKQKMRGEHEVTVHRDTATNRYSCPFCTRTYREVISMGDHIKTHALIDSSKKIDQLFDDIIEGKTIEDSDENVTETAHSDHNICRICGEVFSNKFILNHENNHRNTETQLFDCWDCDISLKRADLFEIHRKEEHVAMADSCYVCEICAKTFALPRYLKLHIQNTHAKGAHPCPICQKEFKTPLHLKHHVKTHSDDRPYMCDICPKTYKDKQLLRYHRYTHGGEPTIECTYCKRKFHHRLALRLHQKRKCGFGGKFLDKKNKTIF